uniref:Uncharacterized protein n=1 Tax=Anguilla anguilla TaxID=7936 RepID=A0A0E9XUK7_ANGAN
MRFFIKTLIAVSTPVRLFTHMNS